MKVSLFILIFSFLFLFHRATVLEPDRLKIVHLTGGLYVFTTYQSYKGHRTSSNGMYLVTDAGVVLIDTPWDTTQFSPLVSRIKSEHKKSVVLCIATHSHEDRTAGLEFMAKQGAKTYTSLQTKQLCIRAGFKQAMYTFESDTVFKVGGYAIQTFYAGAGHTKDNLEVWFPEDKVLYGGCFVKSTDASDLGNVSEADLTEWPNSLKRLQMKFTNPKFVIPGHQSWADVNSIDHTLKLLTENKTKQ